MSIGTMLYGAAVSSVAAVALVFILSKDRRASVLSAAGVAAFLMPIAWNSILRATGATAAFSHDLPFRPFPVSWQDTGSGIFTLAGAALIFGAGVLAREPARHAAALTTLTAIGAFLNRHLHLLATDWSGGCRPGSHDAQFFVRRDHAVDHLGPGPGGGDGPLRGASKLPAKGRLGRELDQGGGELQAFERLEWRLRQILANTDYQSHAAAGGPTRLVREAASKGLVTEATVNAVDGVAVLRNLVAHGGVEDVSTDKAVEYLALVSAVLYAIPRSPSG
ncbi:MAG: hypothetical protein ACJ73E_10035 [Mycobacteriales bacterium]